MYKLEKQKAEVSFFDVEKVRKNNNRALQRLLRSNAELENASDRRSRYQNRKKLEKDEKAFFKNCERRLYKLNLESDIWVDEEKKLDSLYRRRVMLSDVLKTTNEQLIEEAMMKNLNKGAQQQQERLLFVNKELRKNVGMASRQYVEQRQLLEQFIDKEKENKEMLVIQDNHVKEIRQKLKMYNLVTIKKKVNPDDERVNEAIRKNQKLENTLRSLSQQAITVPMLKYRYICAADEKRRLAALNSELETVILVLTERLSDHTGWEFAFQDVEKKVKDQQEAMNDRLRKIEELKTKTKLGTKSMFFSFSKEKMGRDKVTKHLDYLKSKVVSLQKEYRTFQPEIEAFLKELQASSDAAKSENPLNKTGNIPKNRKAEKSSSESSTDSDYDNSDSEESTDINDSSQRQKPAVAFINVSYQSKDERRASSEPTAEETPGSRTSSEDSAESDSRPSKKTRFMPTLIAGCPTSPAGSEGSDQSQSAASSGRTMSSPACSESWWDYLF